MENLEQKRIESFIKAIFTYNITAEIDNVFTFKDTDKATIFEEHKY